MDEVMFKQAAKLRSRYDTILTGNKTYSQLFDQIVTVISQNVFTRVEEGKLTPKESPKKDQNILFQFIGSLNLMHPKEMVRFKMLGNFLESEKSLDTLERILYTPKNQLQEILVDYCLNIDGD